MLLGISNLKYEVNSQGGGHQNNSVVHMHDQRNAKKGLFFRLNAIRANQVKMCLFLRKRVLLDSIKGCLGVIFSNSTKHVLQKSLFRGKCGDKIVRNSRLGVVFPGEGKLGYVLKLSGHTCVQH